MTGHEKWALPDPLGAMPMLWHTNFAWVLAIHDSKKDLAWVLTQEWTSIMIDC